jgi:hypothetical protein
MGILSELLFWNSGSNWSKDAFETRLRKAQEDFPAIDMTIFAFEVSYSDPL